MNIFKCTLLYKTYDCLSSLFKYIKERNYVKDTLYSDEFKFVLKKYLKLNVKRDWIGRLYGIINPLIDINGNLDINNMVIELDDNQTNDAEYVKVWIHKQLKLIGDLFKIHNLYDYINLEMTHVGPINADNYLIVFDIVARKEFAYSLKRFLTHFIVYVLIALCILIFIL